MRILVTGGCGFLGSHLVEHLLRTTDDQIVVLDKLTYASSGFDRLRDVGAYERTDRVQVLGCDLSQPIPDGALQELGDVDYVVHAAAESHVDHSIVDPLPFLMSNVVGTHHLLWAVRKIAQVRRAVARVFVISTDEVYGPAPREGRGAEGYDEEARFRPANPYAASKAGAEALAMSYANTYGLPITILSTMNLLGERQHPEKFVPLVIRRVLRGETVTIHADPTRTVAGTRFYLHCRTLAHALAWLIDRDVDHHAVAGQVRAAVARPAIVRLGSAPAATVGGAIGASRPGLPGKIHVCGEREIGNLELAQIIAGYVGRPLHYELVDFHSSRPGHDLRYAMDDRLIRQLGWVRPMHLEQSLEKTVRWYLAHPRWLEAGKK